MQNWKIKDFVPTDDSRLLSCLWS